MAFTLASLPTLAAALTNVQRDLLDAMWQWQTSTSKPYPKRGLPRIIGKQSLDDIVKGLPEQLFFETQEGGENCFMLTVHGALLSSDGPAVSLLLVHLLDLVNALYEEDSFIKQIDNATVQGRLGLSAGECGQLFSLLRLIHLRDMPCYLSNWALDGSTWSITITDHVIDLYRAPSSTAFLDDRLRLSGSKVPMGVDPDARVLSSKWLQDATLWAQNPQTAVTTSPTRTDYVVPTRLVALRTLRHTDFDFTRLIRLCEELNDCAARANAHAVIMLTRAVLDHVPPAFGYRTFREVASNYSHSGKSFKEALGRLEQQTRKVADRLLHMPIRDREIAPTMKEVDFSPELEMLLAELCRRLK
jgi:hypothetical protein